ncbi:hypothetical protein L202_05011 [Cryptococcus amylolentus CBS 6039]|uniref:DNA polymerase alpha subunit B n=1 Tax=Cryptococcus amylolentus CBS 6039 TaxID=1295533 RepID=A0A1E3HP35_9TREE|nr:hypothetical protein L202_05011 [Cryptococcus amylolentus CBS 6039]ODN77905.1 hypothetical protein L202_05011 [Cryptococcus amylolentus CBS 6039]
MSAPSEPDTSRQLVDRFGPAVLDRPDVMAECLSLLRSYNLSPADLYFKYEAFVMSRPSGLRARLSDLSIDTVRELRLELQRAQQASAVASMGASGASGLPASEKKTAVGVKKTKGKKADLEGLLGGFATPSRPKPTKDFQSATSSLKGTSHASTTHVDRSTSQWATPERLSPLPPTASSHRPHPSRLSSNANDLLAETPTGHGTGGLHFPSSPVSPSGVSPSLSPSILSGSPVSAVNSLTDTLNPHLPPVSQTNLKKGSKPRVELSSTITSADYSYRYMFEKISERSEALDELIDDYAEIIKEAYGLEELADPHLVTDDTVYTVGRVVVNASGVKIDKASLRDSFHLQSSRLIGGGRQIALQFPGDQLQVRGGAPGAKSVPMYSGCLVCLKGRNGGGGKFVVEELLVPPPGFLGQTPASELLDFQHGEKLTGQPISLCVASGPFTLSDNLLYAPLEAVLNKVTEERPDVLILARPFIDSQHPAIKSGLVTESPADIFRAQISERLQKVIDASSGTVIILVPSVRDVVSRHMAFPQAMLDKEELGIPKKVKVLPNPCTFSVNEVNIGISTVDVLFHMGQSQTPIKASEADPDPALASSASNDVFASYIRQVLGQRSFYPIFPVLEDLASEVNLDVTHYPLLKMDPMPDVLILPSKLNKFSKVVDSTLVINPSSLARARATGHYAKIIIHPTPEAELKTAHPEDMLEHQVWDRARSEIWKV